MAEYKLVLPAMGEGVLEAKIISWLKAEGDTVSEDESIVEIATDKVDSEVPSPVKGKIIRFLIPENTNAKVGQAIALLEVEEHLSNKNEVEIQQIQNHLTEPETTHSQMGIQTPLTSRKPANFLSPLIKNLINKESLTQSDLNKIHGSGLGGRITKLDIEKYLQNGKQPLKRIESQSVFSSNQAGVIEGINPEILKNIDGKYEVRKVDRMRKAISKNMLQSMEVAAHVTSFVEVDVTEIYNWRQKNKEEFLTRSGLKLTYMPVFYQIVAKALEDYPMMNISLYDDWVIQKENINIGMATALPDGNLIVPVIKKANLLTLHQLTEQINHFAELARTNNLKPSDTQGGTYTISNIGGFGNIMGTPIINQPQVAILAIGNIEKKPAVITNPKGKDEIVIRQKLFLSHTYDHRIIDGMLGGSFVKHIANLMENFDENTEIYYH